MNSTIYVVITASLLESNWEERYQQYQKGIQQAIRLFQDIPHVKLLIVENTGKTKSFLDDFGIPVLYTNTNQDIITPNKGIKELTDVFKAIEHYQMKDDDFLIKLTGRYFLHDNSPFVDRIRQFSSTPCEVVLRYGGYNLPQIYREKFYSCITGIIGMRVKWVKTIPIPDEITCVEWKWAEVANQIPYEFLCILDYLGITQYISYGSLVVDS
jgi:hypothetical protein